MNSNLSGALSSLNIGNTKSNNEEKDAATNINSVAICAACGKEGDGDSMNTCNKCDLVKYCNAACKKKHRKTHKQKCVKRAAELYDEKLFKDHPMPEDCPICFLPLPFDEGQVTFEACCGKESAMVVLLPCMRVKEIIVFVHFVGHQVPNHMKKKSQEQRS